MSQNVLIIGATSAIIQSTSRIWAERGHSFFLVGRNLEKLSIVAADLKTRGATRVQTLSCDLNDFEKHRNLLEQAEKWLGGIDLVLMGHGTLGDQKKAEADYKIAEQELRTNFLSYVSLLTDLANRLERQNRGGTLAVISSVAGDRGRQSNYVYGTAKGALSIFLQGLRNRLYFKNIHVLTIKPGLTDTPMTAEFKKGLLWTKPETVAQEIVQAVDQRKNCIYTPGFWMLIMLIIRSIPERIFKKLKL